MLRVDVFVLYHKSALDGDLELIRWVYVHWANGNVETPIAMVVDEGHGNRVVEAIHNKISLGATSFDMESVIKSEAEGET